MSQSLIPNFYRYNAAQSFKDSFDTSDIDDGIETKYYYVFAGNHLNYSNTAIPTISDNVYDTEIDVYKNMIFGKLVKPEDVSLMIRKIEYESGKIYAMYDDKDPTMSSKDFYTVVDEGEYYNVFKCLNNNNMSASIVQPTLYSVGSDGILYSPVDGYSWKYMYSIDFLTYDNFHTDKYIPLVVNNYVTSIATKGSIDSIKIIGSGAGYSNYIPEAYFTASDINVYSNVQYYGISGAAGASPLDDFYRGCILQITAGTGAGQYRQIIQYEGSANTKYVILDSQFNVKPDNTSTYSIYPGVYIQGDQTQSTNSIAWAYVNPVGNTISRVEILNRGLGYKTATANVYSHISAGVTSEAVVRPILSPPGGNGFNPANELYCSAAAISVKFSSSESNTIPSTNQFRQIGVILNPTYANATINYSNSIGNFIDGETAYSYYPHRVQENVNISIGNNTATATDHGVFDTLKSNTLVYITDNNTYNQVFIVDTVTNNSVVTFKTESTIEFSNASMYIPHVQASGEIIVSSAGSISIRDITGHIVKDGNILGLTSGAITDTINSIVISGVEKQFDTFVAAYKYTGSTISGTFTQNETVVQISNSVSNAIIHSAEVQNGVTNYYFTNQNGIFNTGLDNTIRGANSGAVAALTNKYVPEIVFGSGEIIYLENLDPIIRDTRQTETFKLVFEF